MMKVLLTVTLVATLTLAGCVQGKITAFKDPFFKGPPMKRFLVIANVQSMESAQQIESAFAEVFKESGIVGIPRVRVMPPVREYTQEEMRQLIAAENVDAYLEMTFAGMTTADIAIPAVSQTNATANAIGAGNTVTARGKSTTVTYGGGSRTVATSASFTCVVLAASDKAVCWKSEVFIDLAQSSAYATFDGMIEKVATLVVDKMQEDRVAYSASKPKRGKANW